jgi:hypothetical protein
VILFLVWKREEPSSCRRPARKAITWPTLYIFTQTGLTNSLTIAISTRQSGPAANCTGSETLTAVACCNAAPIVRSEPFSRVGFWAIARNPPKTHSNLECVSRGNSEMSNVGGTKSYLLDLSVAFPTATAFAFEVFGFLAAENFAF